MSDEQDKPAEEQAPAEPAGPRAGERLAEARREQQIGIHEVAKELHLDEPKVRALENNEFDVLGAPVFAKGHLKKYAELVGVDPDDVLEDYYVMTRQDMPPPIVVARRRARQELSPGPWIAVIVVIIVAAAAYWWFTVYATHAPNPPTATPEPAPAQQGMARPMREPTRQSSEAAQPLPAPVADDAVTATAEPERAEPEPANNQARLTLTFSGDCWTEISDATGQRLFFRMAREGSSVELAGVPPFAALFGDVSSVSVQLNGKDYPVSTVNPGSRMARLTIMAP